MLEPPRTDPFSLDFSDLVIKPASPNSLDEPATESRPLDLPETMSATDHQQKSNFPPVVRGLKKVLYLTGAGLFFVLGFLGALLPVLPATPFLLLTSFFLLRTSPRLNAVLLRSRLVGPILVDWQQHGGVRQHVKLKAVLFVVVAVGLTLVFSSLLVWLKGTTALLACVGIGVILRLPTAE